jgi:CHAD domain-containing protein
MRGYALQQTRIMLRRLAFQLGQAARLGDEGSVHDLRVAIRRFSQCLRIFEPYFPAGEARRIRQKLKTIMAAAATVRDRDIATGLMHAAGVPRRAPVIAALLKERKQAERGLVELIHRAGHDSVSRKWRARLGL